MAKARVAFQGEPGAFSEEAALRFFGEGIEPVACRTLADVFRALARREVDHAVAAIENSQAGSINATYDLLRQHDLFIVGEVYVPVRQCLLALPGAQLSQITRVLSHPAALDQCAEFLAAMGAEAVAVYDTAGGAKHVAQERLEGTGAIASARAADIYGLQVLAMDVQTVRENFTRFVALGTHPKPRGEGAQKTSIVMATTDRAGALYHALGAFQSHAVNLFKIESRPSRSRPWEYVFYLDFEGHRDDAPVREALAELGGHTTFLRVLGSYPAATQARS